MGIRALTIAVTLLAGAAHAQQATDPWLAVDRTMRAALGEHGVPWASRSTTGRARRSSSGCTATSLPTAASRFASASKMVTGVVLFRLVDEGRLSLDSTTGTVLGWRGEKGGITLRHLLSFTSGMQREHVCTVLPQLTLAACVEMIERDALDCPGRHPVRLRLDAPGGRGPHGRGRDRRALGPALRHAPACAARSAGGGAVLRDAAAAGARPRTRCSRAACA
jgi:CubicO group peptidase (beta-lactamase class C family)